jgi:hypothetical protein
LAREWVAREWEAEKREAREAAEDGRIGKGMGGRGMGAREGNAEGVRQNDGGRMIQAQIRLLLSFCPHHFA